MPQQTFSAVHADLNQSLRRALQLGLAFALVKTVIEVIGNIVAQHFAYGIFRDEMYYIVCGRHLAQWRPTPTTRWPCRMKIEAYSSAAD